MRSSRPGSSARRHVHSACDSFSGLTNFGRASVAVRSTAPLPLPVCEKHVDRLSDIRYEDQGWSRQSVLGRRRRRSLGDQAAAGAGRLDLGHHAQNRLAAVVTGSDSPARARATARKRVLVQLAQPDGLHLPNVPCRSRYIKVAQDSVLDHHQDQGHHAAVRRRCDEPEVSRGASGAASEPPPPPSAPRRSPGAPLTELRTVSAQKRVDRQDQEDHQGDPGAHQEQRGPPHPARSTPGARLHRG